MRDGLSLAFLLALVFGSSQDFPSFHLTFMTMSGASVIARLDFGFEHIIVSETSFACTAENSCRFLDNQEHPGEIYGHQYMYRNALIDFSFREDSSNRVYKTPLQVHVTKFATSVFGIHPKASYRESLLPQKALRFRTTSHDAVYSKRTQKDVSLDWSPSEGMFYMNSVLWYSSDKRTTMALANICFHDKDLMESSNYFLQGDENFKDDWRRFRRVAPEVKEFSCSIQFKDVNKAAFVLPYDMGVFDSYDLDPFKAFPSKKSEFCELFAGDFLLQRGSVNFVVEKAGPDGDLSAFIFAEATPYNQSVMYRWQFFIRLTFWLSFSVFVVVIAWNYYRPLFKQNFGDKMSANEDPLLIN